MTHVKAVWNGAVLAESDRTEVVEGNHYFPADTIHEEYFRPSSSRTICPWKGTASYYTVDVGGERNVDAAWYYPKTKEAAKNIEGKFSDQPLVEAAIRLMIGDAYYGLRLYTEARPHLERSVQLRTAA